MTERPVVYQARGLSLWAILIALLTEVSVAQVVLVSGGISAVWDLLWLAFGVAFFAYYVFRLSRIGVHAYEAGVVVKNPVRTTRLAWGDIDRFVYGRFGLLMKVGARLKSGQVVPAAGLSANRLVGSVKRAYEELNERLAQANGETN